MKKKQIKPSTMFNLKGFLYLIAFGVWVYLIMADGEGFKTFYDALIGYGQNTLMIITVLYIAILLLQFFVGIEDTEN
jgi:uncharacterized membrane protein